ncbi:MAG TPA: hypothetical protein VF984_02100, partial [Actinomycetota bacterium]
MRALLSVELRRLAARRLVAALAVLAILGIAVTGIILAVQSGRGPDASNTFALVNVRNVLEGTSFLLLIGGWVVGASFVGAEWQAGSLTTLLTWEPGRIRILAAKAIACAVGLFLLALAIQALFALVLWVVAATRGTTVGANAAWVRGVAGVTLRVGVASALFGLLGLSVAMVGKNTGAAIGVAFAYLAVIEGLIRGLRPGWRPWLLGDNAGLFVVGHASAGSPP